MRIGLLNNLRAGRSQAQVGRLLRFLRAHPEVVHVETNSAQMLPEALSELAERDVELLVINGGDGTLQHALTEILGGGGFGGRVPMIAPLRGGRTNMSAVDLGVQRDPVRGMAAVLEAARSGRIEERVVERRVLRVEYGAERSVLHGMFFGVGVIHRAIEVVHRVFPPGRSQGAFGATLVTGALLSRASLSGDKQGLLAPDKVHVYLDGLPLDRGEYRLVMATTLGRLFAGMRPFWGSGSGGVRFTAIASEARSLWRTVPGILAGRPGPGVSERHGYTSSNAKRADLRTSCGFTVDGELVEPEPGRTLSVTGRETVRFVRT